MNRYQEVFDRQKAYFESDATKPIEWRIARLDAMEKMLRDNQARLEAAISKDFKTAAQEKAFETAAPLAIIADTKRQLADWMQPVKAPLPEFLAESGHRGMIYREPYGVTLVMGPFNGPLLLLLDPAITALAAGNTCILKLNESIANTAELLDDLIPQYFEPEAVMAIRGGVDEVTELLKLPLDFIFCTASVAVGKIVMRAAAEHLTPVLLELGGQNPALVDRTADLKDAAKKIVWGAMAWGGQWCTSPGYAYVEASVADAFADECRKAVIELYGTDPQSNPDYSKIVNAKAVERLAGLIDAEKVIAGGRHDANDRYLDPTVLYPVTWSDRIMENEIFGPILPILTFTDFDEAFAQIKARPRPLSGFIFSRDQKAIDRFLGSISFGGGAVNQVNVHLFVATMPFGGVGDAGIGHYYGKYGFDALTHAKSILISPPDVAIEHLFPPYTEEKVAQMHQWFKY